MKRVFSILSMLLITVTGVSAFDFEVDGICYNLKYGKAWVTSCGDFSLWHTENGNTLLYKGDMTIPSQVRYNGRKYKVEGIDDYAFACCFDLKSVSIPKGVKYIGNSAFWACMSLETVNMPKGLSEISDEAFRECYSLSQIVLPNSLEWIGALAFIDCFGLTDLMIPKKVSYIGDNAFEGCSFNSFANNSRLSDSDGWGMVECVRTDDGLCIKDGVLLGVCKRDLMSYTVPEGVKGIAHYAFYHCENMKSVRLPESLETLDSYVFTDCSGLVEVTLPKNLRSVVDYDFAGCTNLEKVFFPEGFSIIGYRAFIDCPKLKVTIPESVKIIHPEAFQAGDVPSYFPFTTYPIQTEH